MRRFSFTAGCSSSLLFRWNTTTSTAAAAARIQELRRRQFLAHLEVENAAHTRGSQLQRPSENPVSEMYEASLSDGANRSGLLSHGEESSLRRAASSTTRVDRAGTRSEPRRQAPSHKRSVLQQLRRSANQYHTAQAEDILRQGFREALTAILRHQASLKALDPSTDSNAHERAQKLQRLFQDAVQSLTPNHFKYASSMDELVLLLRACSFVGVDSSLAVASSMVMLTQNVAQLNVNQLSAAILAVATCNTSIASTEKTDFIFLLLQRLSQKLDVDASTSLVLTPREVSQCVNVVRLSMKSGDREATEFPHDLSKRFAEQLLTYLVKASNLQQASPNSSGVEASSTSSELKMHSHESLVHRLQGWQLALLCTAVTHFNLSIMTAKSFLQPVAQLVVACCQEMTGRQLSYILLAYATIGYRNVEFFITLGQCVGDLGETVKEDDVARVLRALALVGIEHEMLRNSLESSLRMRHLKRKPLFGKPF